eukprot:ANDGO_03691.mRNA.1 Protein EFR3 homolog cmp44E
MGAACSCQPVYRYQRLVQGVYPNKAGGSMNTSMQMKLNNYAIANPSKLPKIGRAFEKHALQDAKKKRYNFVAIGMKALTDLVNATPDNVNLFVEQLKSVMLLALSQHQSMLDHACAESIIIVAVYLGDIPTVREFDVFIPHLTRMAGQTPSAAALNSSYTSLVAIAKLVTVLDTHALQFADSIVGAVIPNFAGEDAVKNAASDCLVQIARMCSITTMRELAKSVFAVLDHKDLWLVEPFASHTISAVLKGLRSQSGYSMIALVLQHAESALRASKVTLGLGILGMIPGFVAQVRSSGGTRSFEPLNVLVRMVFYSSEIKAPELAPLFQLLLECFKALSMKEHHETQNLEFLALLMQNVLKIDGQPSACERLLEAANVVAQRPATLPVGKYFPDTILHPLKTCLSHPSARVRLLAVRVLTSCFRVNAQVRVSKPGIHGLSPVATHDRVPSNASEDVALPAPLQATTGMPTASSSVVTPRVQHAISKTQLNILIRCTCDVMLKPAERDCIDLIVEAHGFLVLLVSEFKIRVLENLVPALFYLQDRCLSTDRQISPGQSLLVLTSVALVFSAVSRVIKSSALSKYVMEVLEKRRKAGQLPSFIAVNEMMEIVDPTPDMDSFLKSSEKFTAAGMVDTPLNREFVVQAIVRVESVSELLKEETLMRHADSKEISSVSNPDIANAVSVAAVSIEYDTDSTEFGGDSDSDDSSDSFSSRKQALGTLGASNGLVSPLGKPKMSNFLKLCRASIIRDDVFSSEAISALKAFVESQETVPKISDIEIPELEQLPAA